MEEQSAPYNGDHFQQQNNAAAIHIVAVLNGRNSSLCCCKEPEQTPLQSHSHSFLEEEDNRAETEEELSPHSSFGSVGVCKAFADASHTMVCADLLFSSSFSMQMCIVEPS